MTVNPEKYENFGFSMQSALQQLYDDILNVLVAYEEKVENELFIQRLKEFTVYNGPLSWFSTFASLFCVVFLFIDQDYVTGVLLLALLSFTIFLQIRENYLKKTELFRKVRNILDDLEAAAMLCEDWDYTSDNSNFPHIYSPLSPCVSLQWTYRNGRIVNLPWALLVRGDYIVIRPGQHAPEECTEISGKCRFVAGETYRLTTEREAPSKPTARSPLPDLICILDKTPFIENLKTALDNFVNRPPTIFDQQRDLLITRTVQQWGFIFILVVTCFTGILRFTGFYIQGKTTFDWKNIFIEAPVAAVLPILPLIYPVIWILINLWGMARIQTILTIPPPMLRTEQEKSFQEDLDTPSFDEDHIILPREDVLYHWIQLLKGNANILGRSTNVVQVLGTVTALCCVDKKGILSWPNPTAEKVFFLRDAADTQSDKSSGTSLSSEEEIEQKNNPQEGTVTEVLDLTHDQHSPFKLEFDDHEWKNHINSLKPLGLAILVNTCCPLTQKHYASFCGHISAQFDKNLVPVTNRYSFVESRIISFMHGRCLCELARQIGFTPQARNIFHLSGQISSYRHLQPEIVRRDIRLAKSLHISKVKVPFPHSLSVVVKETPSGSLQLLTQGTADLVLDCCDDYWNGKDLKPLTKEDRKRALDFYQRNALTAYCTAFAYRPLRHGICGALSGEYEQDIAYLELPPESRCKMPHVDKSQCEYDDHIPALGHSLSTDSLLFSEKNEEDIGDVDGCFEMQCHQVFIGMVTMQYQAQTDIVQLIERLDRACIRFVHFSKENELRSRVFSEKMGLESGWNCHISLMSDEKSNFPSPKNSTNFDLSNEPDENHRLVVPSGLESTKTLSSSAPCTISNQPVTHNMSTHNSKDSFDLEASFPHRASKDSAMEENCRSLSCLTDITEQSAPINFDMSNRAKLPRGIENIRPHLENVDNVPLLVSLFTDCSAEATREMLSIMQNYGEIVVCLGSSASNANAEIFLTADCSIGIEPLYPQVCQDYPAYTEFNIYNNKAKVTKQKERSKYFNSLHEKPVTISPIYLSRMLNSIPCSVSMVRDDPLSLVTLIELSRRFTFGFWNSIQFWACCACSLTVLNTVACLLTLPPIITPIMIIYLMCIVVSTISVSLVRVEPDPVIMNHATGKKHTSLSSNLIIFVLWCYGCKFLPMVIVMALAFCSFLSYPVMIIQNNDYNFEKELYLARQFILFGVVLHMIAISTTFVHRNYSIWQKNPFRNICWLSTCASLLVIHLIGIIFQIIFADQIFNAIDRVWPIILFIVVSTVLTFLIAELCKWEEIKVNARYQRRARLDFGTKLGMNSPF